MAFDDIAAAGRNRCSNVLAAAAEADLAIASSCLDDETLATIQLIYSPSGLSYLKLFRWMPVFPAPTVYNLQSRSL